MGEPVSGRALRLLRVTTLLSGLGAFSACAHDTTAPPPALTVLPRALSGNEQQVRDASNSFAFSLFQRESAAQPGQSVFLSPLSASYALAIATTGARGATLDSMTTTLGLNGMSIVAMDSSYQSLTTLLLIDV